MSNCYQQKSILIWISALGIICLLFFAFPQLDIQISKMFYTKELGFFYKANYFAKIIFQLVPWLTYTSAIIYISLGLCQYFISKKISKILLYLIITLIIGPGIIVNSLLKENFGRARPRSIIEFGGNAIFSNVFILSDQCQTNCSFSSGHAAAAYIFTNLSFIAPRRYKNILFNSAIVFGTLVGIVRIAQGGHFASDVFFSFLVVLAVNYICKRMMFRDDELPS